MLTVGGWAGLGGQRDPRHAAAGGALPSESGPIFTEQPMRISGMLTGGRETGEGPRTRFKTGPGRAVLTWHLLKLLKEMARIAGEST